jgi:hypothetical protein
MLETPHFLFADERISRIDSLATPNHPMVDPIWPGRMPVTTLVIAAGKSRWRGRIGIANHRTETRLREFAHRLRETVRPSTR